MQRNSESAQPELRSVDFPKIGDGLANRRFAVLDTRTQLHFRELEKAYEIPQTQIHSNESGSSRSHGCGYWCTAHPLQTSGHGGA